MDKRTFQAAIYELSLYFERKPPGDNTITQWYEEIKYIPGKQIQNLIADVKNLDSWPRNLPAFMRKKSSEYSEQSVADKYAIHPRRIHPERYAKNDCPTCKGTGLTIWITNKWPIRKDEEGNIIYQHREEPCLCNCTDEAEYGF